MSNVVKAKDELEKILNGEEYSAYRDQSKSLLAVMWEKLKSWLAEILSNLFPDFEAAGTFVEPILIILIVVVLALIGVVGYFIIRNQRRKRKAREHKPLHSLQEIDWSPKRHLIEATRYEDLGHYALATRHLFLALLLQFHENEWLEARIWKTNWEYYEELKRVNKQSADQFYHFAHFFDEATYGERDVERSAYMQFKAGVLQLLGDFGDDREG